MTRLIRHLLLAPLLGIITTAAVAWGCALWIELGTRDLWTSPGHSIRTFAALSLQFKRTGASRSFDATHDDVRHIEDARGFPFLAMRGSFDIDSPDGRGNIENVRGAIMIDFGTRLPGADRTMTPLIPLGIIWRGFILNALIFAAIWFALLAGPGTVKRTLRRRRGACIDCGYDLRGAAHEQCPECGRETR